MIFANAAMMNAYNESIQKPQFNENLTHVYHELRPVKELGLVCGVCKIFRLQAFSTAKVLVESEKYIHSLKFRNKKTITLI